MYSSMHVCIQVHMSMVVGRGVHVCAFVHTCTVLVEIIRDFKNKYFFQRSRII